MRARHVFFFFLASSLLLPLAIARPPENEDARLHAKFMGFLDEEFRLRPTYATSLGDHRFDDRLDDVSPKARAGWAKHHREALTALEKDFDPKKLSRASQIDLEIWKHYLKFSLWSHENTKPFEEDPRAYNELISDSVYTLLTQSSLPQSTNVRQRCCADGLHSTSHSRRQGEPEDASGGLSQDSHQSEPWVDCVLRKWRLRSGGRDGSHQ